MPKTVSTAMQAMLDSQSITAATCWRVTRKDGTILRFTDHDQDIVFGGETFESSTGYGSTAIVSRANLAADNLEVGGIMADGDLVLNVDAITEEDLRDGLYDDATIEIFLVDWIDPDGSSDVKLKKGTVGELNIKDGRYTLELRGLTQRLAKRFGEVYEPACKVELFSQGFRKCNLDPDGNYEAGTLFAGEPYKETSEVLSSPSRDVIVLPTGKTLRSDQDAQAAADKGDTDNVEVDSNGFVTLLPGPAEDGSPLRPYRISTPAELDDIRNNVNAHYILEADIDMGAFGLFTPIPAFAGELDGRGYQVQNLDLDHNAAPRETGLFEDFASGAVVRRLGIVDATVRSGDTLTYAAPLAADADNATIEDCYAEGGSVTTDGDLAGGLVGQMGSGTVIRRCYAAVLISGTVGADVGAFAGTDNGVGTEASTFFDSDVATTSQNAGGATELTTTQAQTQGSFTGFDFNSDWKLPPGTLTGDPNLTFADTNPDTITRAAGSWLDDGFVAGMVITVALSSSNNGTFTIASLTATVITLVAGDTLVAEGPANGITVTGSDYPRHLDPGRCP